MTLSEAIRLGAMLHPQGYGAFYRDGATCANGAALDAISALDTTEPEDCGYRNIRLRAAFPLTVITAPPCPQCGVAVDTLEWLIAHLNDWHRWTRERIADFVASVEPQDSSVTAAAISAPVDALTGSLRA